MRIVRRRASISGTDHYYVVVGEVEKTEKVRLESGQVLEESRTYYRVRHAVSVSAAEPTKDLLAGAAEEIPDDLAEAVLKIVSEMP